LPPRAKLIRQIRNALRDTLGVLLIQDLDGLPVPSNQGHNDVGLPDIMGSYVSTCPHWCKVPRPFAFLVMGPGIKVAPGREHWLGRLRAHGWVTAMVMNVDDALAAIKMGETSMVMR
jgi:hypothetical protein